MIFDAETTSSNITISSVLGNGLQPVIFIDDIKVSALPMVMFSENFDDAKFPPSGWTSVNVSGGTQWIRTTSQALGAGSAMCSYTSNGNNWLITPKLFIESGNQLSFQVKTTRHYSGTDLFVKVSTAGNSVEDFHEAELKKVENSMITLDWATHTVDLSAYVGKYIYIGFQDIDHYGLDLMLDEVSGGYIVEESCYAPSDISIIDVTDNSAKITWNQNQGNPTKWILEYSSTKDFSGDVVKGEVTGSTLEYVMSGLNANKEYFVRLKSDCSAGDYSDYTEVYSFKTACGEEIIGFANDFSPENVVNDMPDCWSRVVGYQDAYPKVFIGAGNKADGCVDFYMTGGDNVSIIATPPFSIPLNTVEVSFWVQNKNVGVENVVGRFEVGVMSNINDSSTFIPVADCTPSDREWTEYHVQLSNINAVYKYIAFRSTRTTSDPSLSYTFYLDDVTTGEIPSCIEPKNVNVVDITQTGFYVSWSAGGSETQWQLEYKKNNETTWQQQTVSNPYYSVTGLDAMTTYDVRVKAICSTTDESRYTFVKKVKTACGQMNTYFNDFDDNILPDCWTYVAVDNGVTPSVKEDSFGLGTTSPVMYFRDFKPLYAVMPKCDSPLSGKELSIGVIRESSSSGVFQVGVMSDPIDTTTFQPIFKFQGDKYKQVISKTLYFDDIVDNGNNRYIAFRYGDVGDDIVSTYYACGLDEVSLQDAPLCRKVKNIKVKMIEATTAQLNFEAGLPSQTVWQYVITDDSAISTPETLTPVDISTMSAPIVNLNPESNYKIWVRAKCMLGGNDDYSVWSDVVEFRTACSNTLSAGYEENFDNLTPNDDGILPDCWRKITNHGKYPAVVEYWEGSSQSGNAVRMLMDSPQYLIMTKLASPINEYRLEFKSKRDELTSGVLQVGYMSDVTDPSTFVLVENINDGVYGQKVTHRVLFDDVVDNGANRYIVFRYGAVEGFSFSEYSGYWIDDIKVEALPSCLGVSNMQVNATTNNSATISFTASDNSQNAWEYVYTDDMTITDPNTMNAVSVTSPTFVISNLESNKEYSLWLRAVCGANVKSDWSLNPIKFRTQCSAVTIGWTDAFDEGNTENYEVPFCWTKLKGISSSTQMTPAVVTGIGHDSVGALEFINYYDKIDTVAFVASPEFDTNLSGMEISFWLNNKKPNYSDRSTFEVGVVSDLSNTDSFISIREFSSVSADNWQQYKVYIPTVSDDYKYVALRMTANKGTEPRYLVDDISVNNPPTCIQPQDLAVMPNTLTAENADITWSAGGSETAWVFEYKKAQDTEWTSVNVSTNSYTITSLESVSKYYVRVKAICVAGTDESDWSQTEFETPCAGMSLPFMEDFSTSSGTQFPPNECWQKRSGKASDIFAGETMGNGSSFSDWKYANNDYGINSKKAYIQTFSSYLNYWLITPEIKLINTVSPMLEFSIAMVSASYQNPGGPAETDGDDDKFMVVISEDGGNTWLSQNATIWSNDGSGSKVLNDIPGVETRVNIDLSQYSGKTIKIGFYAESTEMNSDNAIYIDSIEVKSVVVTPPTVSKPISSEGFYYKIKTNNMWRTSIDGNLVGLTEGTTYEFYAYAIVNGTSFYGDTLEFTTLGQAPVPPTVITKEANNITQTSAQLHAIFIEEPSEVIISKGFQYKESNSTTWVSSSDSLLSNLTANKEYQYYAYAKTAINPAGYNGDTLTFRTLSHTAPTVTTLSATDITINSAVLNKNVIAGTEAIVEEGWKYRRSGTEQWFSTTDATLSDLSPKTKYEYYAYAVTGSIPETSGNQMTFTTLAQPTGVRVVDYTINIYPNPADDVVNISLDGIEGDATIKIIDIQGKLLSKSIVPSGQSVVSINISNMLEGNYLVKIITTKGTEKLIIKR